MSKSTFVYVTYIAAAPEKVWNALIDEDAQKKYWGRFNASDWKVGSKWEHRRIDGSNSVDLIGKVIESSPPTRLVISWANPTDVDKPDAFSRVTFDVAPHEGGNARLTVTHDELVPGSDMERGISGGWPRVLSNLKTYLETGRVMPITCGK
jgi:uncharacterized protein YndB with AHSA1/START domain